MNHKIKGRKFNRYSAHRKAMFVNLTKSLLEHEQITTTLAKAKDLRSVAEKMVSLGKKGTLHARRKAIAYLRDEKIVAKLFSDIASRAKTRPGGYTRVLKAGFRKGDCAPMALIQLVDISE
jgi:large subunit ribosomal protein L17